MSVKQTTRRATKRPAQSFPAPAAAPSPAPAAPPHIVDVIEFCTDAGQKLAAGLAIVIRARAIRNETGESDHTMTLWEEGIEKLADAYEMIDCATREAKGAANVQA